MNKTNTIKYLRGLEGWTAKFAFILSAFLRSYSPKLSIRLVRRYLNGKYKSPQGNIFNLRIGTIDGLVVHPAHEKQSHDWIDEYFQVREGELPDGVMIDIGGYCASFTLRHISKFKNFYIFEPFEKNYLSCLENIQLSHALNQVQVINAAISDLDGFADFILATDDTHSLINHSNQGGSSNVNVKTMRLDTFIAKNNIAFESIRFVKADVEGAELLVLRGASELLEKGSPIILMEANSKSEELGLTEFLTHFGYKRVAVLDTRNCIYIKE